MKFWCSYLPPCDSNNYFLADERNGKTNGAVGQIKGAKLKR